MSTNNAFIICEEDVPMEKLFQTVADSLGRHDDMMRNALDNLKEHMDKIVNTEEPYKIDTPRAGPVWKIHSWDIEKFYMNKKDGTVLGSAYFKNGNAISWLYVYTRRFKSFPYAVFTNYENGFRRDKTYNTILVGRKIDGKDY